MQTIPRTHVIYAMSRDHEPVARVAAGSVVCFETCDCFADQIADARAVFHELDWSRINPATGPVFVEGALPGDVLRVAVERITVRGSQAVMVTAPGLGAIGAELHEPYVRLVPLIDNHAVLPGGIRWPLEPMIGVIGVAPAAASVSCGTPGGHGGNMDCKLVRRGATLWLPVHAEGALFALGDVHAAMGDGEVSVCGLEVPAEVVVRLDVVKGRRLPTPLVATPEAICTIASAVTLDEAAGLATRQMADFVSDGAGLPLADAIDLMSIAGDLQICQVVDPLKTCRFSLPRTVADTLGITLE
jgi:amidase